MKETTDLLKKSIFDFQAGDANENMLVSANLCFGHISQELESLKLYHNSKASRISEEFSKKLESLKSQLSESSQKTLSIINQNDQLYVNQISRQQSDIRALEAARTDFLSQMSVMKNSESLLRKELKAKEEKIEQLEKGGEMRSMCIESQLDQPQVVDLERALRVMKRSHDVIKSMEGLMKIN